jgi:zinc-ribbon domain
MYCPNCGQQQISEEMRFCSRCGLALSGLAEWLATGRLPLKSEDEARSAALSPRRKGIRRAAKLMFFSGVMFPIFLVFSIAIEEPGPMFFPFALFFVSLAMMLYARLFSDKHAPMSIPAGPQPLAFDSSAPRYIPPANTVAMPHAGRHQVRTNELAQPPSVTENTTRLLDNE